MGLKSLMLLNLWRLKRCRGKKQHTHKKNSLRREQQSEPQQFTSSITLPRWKQVYQARHSSLVKTP